MMTGTNTISTMSRIKDRQKTIVSSILNLNVDNPDEQWNDVWKVLVYDEHCRDIIFPLFSVNDLRKFGVTLNLHINTKRQPVADVPAIYFVEPTEENIDRICKVQTALKVLPRRKLKKKWILSFSFFFLFFFCFFPTLVISCCANSVAPISAHAAFDKACNYFGIKLVHVPVDSKTFRVNAADMRRAVTGNTIALVGSAPSFPQGVVDPIMELSKIALEHDIGLHVDACLGGFVLPFATKLGYDVPPFDFLVPGVTTMSCDTHKYGYAPKGSSVVLYRSEELRHYQYFCQPTWPGGIYASPTMAGSRPGGLIAACWATMMMVGEEGYLRNTDLIMKTAKKIEQRVRDEFHVDDISVAGEPNSSVVAFVSKNHNVFNIAEAMTNRGWNLNSLQEPNSIHICVTLPVATISGADKFVEDLKESLDEVMNYPERFKDGMAAIYGMAESIPDKSLIHDMAYGYLDVMYKTEA
eukprot:TRINITY_DN3953_c0_g1_i8.p1 TRINITY_DN3953_c0_g1~~TRINITY_DN3953_c0_g1_i8.p1  ORF type:complete len:468 (-),score=99.42 TRINITY_DN3953_c0_g1_i8:4-1407(-)